MKPDEHNTTTGHRSRRAPDRVPKLIGADVELGNFIEGVQSTYGSGNEASRRLLREIPGVPQSSFWGGIDKSSSTYSTSNATRSAVFAGGNGAKDDHLSQDWGRKFLPTNGGCVYIDLDHLELCIPEVLSAFDYVASWHAMLRVARQAQQEANARLPAGQRIQVLVNTSDGLDHSYGSHLNFLISRRAWDDLFCRKLHYQAFLASYQATSIVLTGQGKVGAENGAPSLAYQISQRADFFETMTGLPTTHRRPLVNSRNEPLCGLPGQGKATSHRDSLARLHCIFYDSNLCHVACLLKCGMMQIALAMIEAGRVPGQLILDDPLGAVRRFSHDPTLHVQARTVCGQQLTAVEWQLLFLEEAQQFVEAGECEGIVPRAKEILSLAADTLEKLHAGDLPALAGRLDWVLKLFILERAIEQRPGLTWDSPELKHLDHVYSSLDPDEGLYWLYEKAGLVEPIATPGEIERMIHEPPDDTRAFTRAMLLRQAGPKGVSRIDWDYLSVKVPGRWGWPSQRTLEMPDPLGLTRTLAGHAFGHNQDMTDVLDALEASTTSLENEHQPEGVPSHAVPQTS